MSDTTSPRTRGAEAARATAGAAGRWLRAKWRWIVGFVVAVAVVGGAAFGGWLLYLNHQIGNIDRVAVTLPDDRRPPPTHGKELNILLAGADNGSAGRTIAQDAAAGRWEPGSHRSDTIMILHVPPDRKQAYLVSIPRDSYVKLYDANGDYTYTDKINAAFSLYGPSGMLSTVEHLTGLRMDHLAIVDWQGFKDVSHAIGGVPVYIPQTFYDDSQKVTWRQGWHTLEGQKALQYVRTRHGLTNGDFDRIARQQNFMRSMMRQLLGDGVMHSPTKLTSALKAIASNMTVDDGWSTGDIRGLALSLRKLHTEDVTFVTAPLGSYDTTDSGESIVRLDAAKSAELWKALADDELGSYVDAHKDDALTDPRNVS